MAALPGPTPFWVQPDSLSSLYVSWETPDPPSTHPLLLNYQILITDLTLNLTNSSGRLPANTSWWVAEGLREGREYQVLVVSWSPMGRGEEASSQTSFTFGPGVPPL